MTTAPHTLHLIGLEGAAAVPALPVIALQGREILGALYRYEVQCEAATLTDSPEYLLGSRVQLTLGAQTASPRLVWGIATDLELKHTRGVPQLNVVIEPRLAGLRGLRLNQTFLDQSSIATVQTVLEEAGLSAQWQDWQATQLADYPRFAQRTCHDQDALGLCLWLLEYEGIGLRFEHTPAGERMVFFDSLGGYARDVAPYMAGLRLAPPGGFASNADVDLDSADASAEPETLNHLDLVQRGQPEAVRLSAIKSPTNWASGVSRTTT